MLIHRSSYSTTYNLQIRSFSSHSLTHSVLVLFFSPSLLLLKTIATRVAYSGIRDVVLCALSHVIGTMMLDTRGRVVSSAIAVLKWPVREKRIG